MRGDLGRFMHRLTVTHVRRWHEHRHSTGRGHVYQGTYKSFPVQEDMHFLKVARYVGETPFAPTWSSGRKIGVGRVCGAARPEEPEKAGCLRSGPFPGRRTGRRG